MTPRATAGAPAQDHAQDDAQGHAKTSRSPGLARRCGEFLGPLAHAQGQARADAQADAAGRQRHGRDRADGFFPDFPCNRLARCSMSDYYIRRTTFNYLSTLFNFLPPHDASRNLLWPGRANSTVTAT